LQTCGERRIPALALAITNGTLAETLDVGDYNRQQLVDLVAEYQHARAWSWDRMRVAVLPSFLRVHWWQGPCTYIRKPKHAASCNKPVHNKQKRDRFPVRKSVH
jgi:hypothetical protein